MSTGKPSPFTGGTVDAASSSPAALVIPPTRAVLPGMLTVRGVTRPVSLLIEQIAVTPESFTADGTMHIDRAEFGVTAYRGLADRYLGLTVQVRCVRK